MYNGRGVMMIAATIVAIAGSGYISVFMYKKIEALWIDKKEKLDVLDRIAFRIYKHIENKKLNRDLAYKEAAIRHLAEIYDYIAIKSPEVGIANQILKDSCVLEILDYWNCQYGRLIKVRISKIEGHKDNIFLFSLEEISRAAFNLKNEKDTKVYKLRVVK